MAVQKETKRTKVFWTEGESRAVAAEAAAIIEREPTIGLKVALTQAQSVLPAHRRRPLYSSAVASLSKLARALLSEKKEQQKVATELPPPLPKPTPDSIIEDLAETIGKAFAELFATALRASVAHTKTALENPVQASRRRLPKLTIVGLLPGQKNVIAAEFAERYDLRFWKDESPHTLRSLTKTSDAVICMSDWISHGHQDLIKGVDPSKLRLVPGTVSRLREYLNSQHQEAA